MPAARRTIPRRDPSSNDAALLAYWRGDPPPAGIPTPQDREAVLSAYYFSDDRKEHARRLGKSSYAASDDDHPHAAAWQAWLQSTNKPGDGHP